MYDWIPWGNKYSEKLIIDYGIVYNNDDDISESMNQNKVTSNTRKASIVRELGLARSFVIARDLYTGKELTLRKPHRDMSYKIGQKVDYIPRGNGGKIC